MAYRTYSTANGLTVSKGSDGDFTTIGTALAAAVSGDTIFIRPGTYIENPTLKPGVNLVAFSGDQTTPEVTIVGKCTLSVGGIVSISNIQLQTNSDFFLAVTGSAASVINLHKCGFNATNNTGISFTNSNGGSVINIFNCLGDVATTGIGLFAHSSAGAMTFAFSSFTNSGGSTTQSTVSAGTWSASYSVFSSPITSSGTSTLNFFFSRMATNPQNTTCVTFGGSGASGAVKSSFQSGTASAASITGANVTFAEVDITSTNANAITGAGTLKYTTLNYIDTGKSMNVTTQTPLNFGTWTPTIVGTVAGSTTYTTQAGYFTIVGNLVYIEAEIVITAATGTGNAVLGGFPYTIKNLANYLPIGNIQVVSATWTWPASNTMTVVRGVANSTTANIGTAGSGQAGNLQMNNSGATFIFSMWYQI